jgi:hypothetical protein
MDHTDPFELVVLINLPHQDYSREKEKPPESYIVYIHQAALHPIIFMNHTNQLALVV